MSKINKIDYSEIPTLDFENLGMPLVGRFYKPLKKQISIRIDVDVLEWLKHSAKKYQALINKICREYMEDHTKISKSTKHSNTHKNQ